MEIGNFGRVDFGVSNTVSLYGKGPTNGIKNWVFRTNIVKKKDRWYLKTSPNSVTLSIDPVYGTLKIIKISVSY